MARHRNRSPGPPKPPKSPGDDYEVGYGRPPRPTRWRKGQSGNPRGRPPKEKPDLVRELLAVVETLARENVPASGPYGPTEVQALHGIAQRMLVDAMNDSKSAIKFFALFAKLQGAHSAQPAQRGEDDDFAQLERFEQRLAKRLSTQPDLEDDDDRHD